MTSTDREALVALFRSTGGAGWGQKGNWGTDSDLATWDGVRVHGQGHIPQLADLGALQSLHLFNNKLKGPIPPELGNLAELKELLLWTNQLSGGIPEELGNLTALTHLWLNGNSLEGPIPPELGKLAALKELSLSSNHLSGPIPPELGNLGALIKLRLAGNELAGSIPPELGKLAALRWLDLRNNHLTGEKTFCASFRLNPADALAGHISEEKKYAVSIMCSKEQSAHSFVITFLTSVLVFAKNQRPQVGKSSQLLGYWPWTNQKQRSGETNQECMDG
ncbi:unnamed protein product [Ectocarpus sp. 13 AM-2016]